MGSSMNNLLAAIGNYAARKREEKMMEQETALRKAEIEARKAGLDEDRALKKREQDRLDRQQQIGQEQFDRLNPEPSAVEKVAGMIKNMFGINTPTTAPTLDPISQAKVDMMKARVATEGARAGKIKAETEQLPSKLEMARERFGVLNKKAMQPRAAKATTPKAPKPEKPQSEAARNAAWKVEQKAFMAGLQAKLDKMPGADPAAILKSHINKAKNMGYKYADLMERDMQLMQNSLKGKQLEE